MWCTGWRRITAGGWAAMLMAALTSPAAILHAQVQPANPAANPAASPAVNLPGAGAGGISFQHLPETVEVRALLEYVSSRLGINIAFDEAEVGKVTVSLRAPQPVPPEQVLPLIESVLRMKGLALVEGPIAGWKRVIPFARLADASSGVVGPRVEDNRVVTRVFQLKFMDPTAVRTLITPFLSRAAGPQGGTGGSVEVLTAQRALVVTDFAANLERVASVLEVLDVANPTEIRFVSIVNGEARLITRQLSELMTARAQAEGAQQGTRNFKVIADERTNQLALVGSREEVQLALDLLAQLDKPIDRQANPVQSYPLANANAEEVLQTIQRLEGENGVGAALGETTPEGAALVPPAMNSPSGAMSPMTTPGNMTPSGQPFPPNTSSIIPVPVPPGRTDTLMTTPSTRSRDGGAAGAKNIGSAGGSLARVTADPHTNSIIVIGPPQVQKFYSSLISMLDRRRPQVLIDVMLVTLDTSDNFELGVDIGTAGGTSPRVITFSRYGIGAANTTSGGLTLPANLGAGFTGAILGAGDIDIVINALKSTNRARITSSPRMLVNDNAEAKLSSIAEEPFETSVVTSTSVAQQSFGGFEKAGAIIKVQPHISEDDYLSLEYEIELSTFVGDRPSEGLPPARRTDVTSSIVTIPDASTIIVGGINSTRDTYNVARVPLLGEIPIIEFLFSDRSERKDNRTFFVFIRPVILRDREFRDLRYYSGREAKKADVHGDHPPSKPVLMR